MFLDVFACSNAYLKAIWGMVKVHGFQLHSFFGYLVLIGYAKSWGMLMEQNSSIEQFKQELIEEPVQTEMAPEKQKTKQTQKEKRGGQKWNQQLLKRVLNKIDKIEATQRVILNGLKGAGYFHFGVSLIDKYACIDEVDCEIIDCVRAAGSAGVFPKDVAASLLKYKLEYYDVSRRIVRMNRSLKKETGELLFEKRGHRWALTRFAFEVYGLGIANNPAGLGKL